MKNYIFSSLFFVLLFGISCNDLNRVAKKNPSSDFSSKHYKISRNKKLSFNERKAALDSLILETSEIDDDSSLIVQLGYKSYLFNAERKYDSALVYAQKMFSKSSIISDTLNMAKSLFKIGLSEYYKNNLLEAYSIYNKSANLFLKLEDSSEVGKKLLTMAVIQKKLGDFLGSEETAIKALKFLQHPHDRKYILGSYHNLSITSKEQKNYDEALEWNKRALDSVNKNTLEAIKYINTKGVILIKQGKYKKALETLSEAYSNQRIFEPKYKNTKARVLDNMAYAKSKLNDPNGLNKLIEALKLRKETNDFSGQFASYIHLVSHHKDRNQNEVALQYAENAFEIAKEIKGAEAKLEALSYILTLAKEPKKEFVLEYQRLNDSINTFRQKIKNQFAKIKYKTDEAQETVIRQNIQIAQNKYEKSKDENQKLALTILLLIVSSIGIFINRHRKQQTKIARIKERHKTNSRLSKKLHDEVGNDLYYLLLQLQKVSGFTSDQENLKILKGFNTVYHKLRDFSRDHKIETGEEYGDELLSLLDSYGDENTKVITSELETSFWTEVSPLKKEELYWVLKELLTNMKKHSQATIVAVTFTKEKKKITVNYIDNGIGTNLKKTISKNGLSNVEIRIKDIGGTITFDSKPEEGFKANIVFTP